MKNRANVEIGTAAPVWGLDTIRAVFKTGIWDWILKPYCTPAHLTNIAYFLGLI